MHIARVGCEPMTFANLEQMSDQVDRRDCLMARVTKRRVILTLSEKTGFVPP